MSGNVVYDFFMGAPLHPRFGEHLDIKMIAEVILPEINTRDAREIHPRFGEYLDIKMIAEVILPEMNARDAP